ncbi:hypothetical protein AKJ43_03460 [candidate division MSBL1 archaeon SCGC-AAA261D19]|uniref:Bacterial type II secretion system protein E domain-containing protein n=1 Tax=candidate division MSBL1 archaeon SCGC-AAA261D19 TaxID=1698273 RepID=A0A133V4F6_9EURY|nr:hypothetical protein AKJ43_03460 [candidate division MSBL1 archaeon SCGC-AAA261D19]
MMKCNITGIGNKQVLEFGCRECDQSPSIAKSEVCMQHVLEKLGENPSTDKILLDGDYVREYGGKNIELLKELIHSLEDSRYLALKNGKGGECGICYGKRKERIDRIWNTLEKDPAQGYLDLEQFKAELKGKSKRGSKQCKDCRKNFLEKGVEQALAILKGTSIIEESRIKKGQRCYGKVLNPSIRPCFLRSKLKLQPPNDAELVDAYQLEDSEIRIYRLSRELQHIYFLSPLAYRQDTAELPMDQLKSLGFKTQSLRVQPAIAGSQWELKAEDALRAALRLGESVLVVGEVRGPETKMLYEAMRVGAAGNCVMGTIHGSSTKDVFERVVYDLGIPSSSFKATDLIVVASPIRPKGG